MDINEYQRQAAKTDTFNDQIPVIDLTTAGFIEKVLGLTGESGEVADKIKKIIRDKNGQLIEEDKQEIALELGDVLWYVANISRVLGLPLEEIAEKNIDKLTARYKNNTIHGSGDHR